MSILQQRGRYLGVLVTPNLTWTDHIIVEAVKIADCYKRLVVLHQNFPRIINKP